MFTHTVLVHCCVWGCGGGSWPLCAFEGTGADGFMGLVLDPQYCGVQPRVYNLPSAEFAGLHHHAQLIFTCHNVSTWNILKGALYNVGLERDGCPQVTPRKVLTTPGDTNNGRKHAIFSKPKCQGHWGNADGGRGEGWYHWIGNLLKTPRSWIQPFKNREIVIGKEEP